MVQLAEHFESNERSRHSEWLRQQRWFVKARIDHERKQEIADKLEDGLITAGVDAIIANDIQIAEMQERLDTYQEATTQAIMINQEKLDLIEQQLILVQAKLDAMLDEAYVMEDGRRVFKSEDGSYAVDEFGEEVNPDEIDFDLLPTHPSADNYMSGFEAKSNLLEHRDELLKERDELFDFRDKLDAAQGTLDKVGLTEDELLDLDKDILEFAPPTVMKEISGIQPENAQELKSSFASPASPKSDVIIEQKTDFEALGLK